MAKKGRGRNNKPSRQRYNEENRAFKHKRNRAQKYANKFGHAVIIKDRKNNDLVTVNPEK